jgi:serine phosphatase RsbU (regulator of sigma subunit)
MSMVYGYASGMAQEEARATPIVGGDRSVPALVQEILSAIPGGCTFLVPVRDDKGEVIDFLVAAAGGQRPDIYGRGASRVHALVSELYPSMVDGPLWRLYEAVLATGEPGQLNEFRHEEKQAGIVAETLFDVSVHPVLDGLLVWWERLDEDQRRLARTEHLGRLGWAEYDLATGLSDWSPGMYRIFERDPALGPMSLAEQGAGLLPDDRGLSETAWQTLDSGAASDVTVRFSLDDTVKYLRILSDTARDADGTPLKIYAVVQDVTAREDSRSEIERLSDQLRKREITALAEHRLAGQLQNMIQPIPAEPFQLAGLDAAVTYLPAESAVQVGGDWYHAQTVPGDGVVLAIGDVAGHGLQAASGMAYLRYALFAWLSIGIRDPGLLLGHLNQLCTQLGLTGSAVVALYDPESRIMRWGRAGHPPPLLARAGAAEPLAGPAGLLLGARPDAAYRASSARLRADDLVLFYTDGLVERRGAGPLALLDQVLAALGEVSAQPDEQSVARIRELLSDPSPYDDTCTLAVRVRP